MEHSGVYGGPAHPYHLQDPSAGPVHPHLDNPAEPPPVHYNQPPLKPINPFSPSVSAPMAATAAATSAQLPYNPYDHPPNPNPISSWPDAPAPVNSHLYQPPPSAAGAAPQPRDVDAYASNPYTSYAGYDGHAAHYGYPCVGAASYYHGLAGNDARVFSAKEAIRQYGVDPVDYGKTLGRPPDFSMNQKKPAHPRYNSAWKKDKKIRKFMKSAYCKVCKVDCNSQEVLISHRQGKKHKKNMEKLQESIAPKPAEAPATTAEKDKTASEQTEKKAVQATTAENKVTPQTEKDKTASGQNKKKSAPATEVDLQTKKRRLLQEGATEDAMRVCTICNIVCNSEVVFNYHIAGQKHAAMVKKQAASAN